MVRSNLSLFFFLFTLPVICYSFIVYGDERSRRSAYANMDLHQLVTRSRNFLPQDQTIKTKVLYVPDSMIRSDSDISSLDRYRVCFFSPIQCYLPPKGK
ncbi:unnamed protein product, partial [Mesorhabditis belari]|uniref:Uncharacterized protein n=1 Tax=Mesorhabditis belari TaxID=2138241 RepID=A0AAF3FL96_9BILA